MKGAVRGINKEWKYRFRWWEYIVDLGNEKIQGKLYPFEISQVFVYKACIYAV